MIIPFFLPHAGCKQKCVFCDAWLLADSVEPISKTSFHAKVSSYLGTKKNHINDDGIADEIAFYGSNFTGIDIAQQRQLLEWANNFIVTKQISHIRISTRPDYISQSHIDFLKSYNVKTVEIGAQSLCDDVLLAAQRGHDAQVVHEAIAMLKANGMRTALHLMVGLPKDNLETFLATVAQVVSIKPDMVRIHPTLVFADTPLAALYRQGEYTPLNLEKAVDLCKRAMEQFLRANIAVIRLGLQLTEDTGSIGKILAGPYHPSLGILIYEGMLHDQLTLFLDKNDCCGKIVVLTCSSKDKQFITKISSMLAKQYSLLGIEITESVIQKRGIITIKN